LTRDSLVLESPQRQAKRCLGPAPIPAIRAGRLLDPEAGRVLTNQVTAAADSPIRDVGQTGWRNR
jgi:hypothetical protein